MPLERFARNKKRIAVALNHQLYCCGRRKRFSALFVSRFFAGAARFSAFLEGFVSRGTGL